MTPQNNPTINPARTSNNVCCFTMMRAVPSIPDSKMKKQSHDTGLKLKIRLYDNRPPTIMPLLATWVLIFHLKFITVQMTMQMSVATMMPDI